MSNPTFKIYGQKRRELKKELGELKRYVKNFWYFHDNKKETVCYWDKVLKDKRL